MTRTATVSTLAATARREDLAGVDRVILENGRVRAVVLPKLGGRLWELTDLRRERQWVWHRADVPLDAALAGARYDDVWAGGWEELFPNDQPTTFEGAALPDHGEWWTMTWHVAELSGGDPAVLRLVGETRALRARCVKEFRLPADGESIHVSYRIETLEGGDRHFLFKPHWAMAVTPGCQLQIPGGNVQPVEPGFGTLARGASPFPWPGAGSVDLSFVPAPSETAREFVCVSGLPEGWCAIVDPDRDASLRIAYEARHFPYLWLFLAYGGWRGCYTVVIEPCTNFPKDLPEAARLGQSARLSPGSAFETSIVVTLGSRAEGSVL